MLEHIHLEFPFHPFRVSCSRTFRVLLEQPYLDFTERSDSFVYNKPSEDRASRVNFLRLKRRANLTTFTVVRIRSHGSHVIGKY